MKGLLQKCTEIPSSLLVVSGFQPPFEFTLSSFSVCKAKRGHSDWQSDPFHSHPGGYMFKLSMHMEANKATHIVKVWENSNCVREGGREGGRERGREGGRKSN